MKKTVSALSLISGQIQKLNNTPGGGKAVAFQFAPPD